MIAGYFDSFQVNGPILSRFLRFLDSFSCAKTKPVKNMLLFLPSRCNWNG
ncbi:hypothetical protein [Bacillus sp. ISL-39]|nr:hypothetical protein [Bacillus sp. ISL-39]MBT2637087.1 hypothetical protein [Bacillus sp. ISL-39]